MSIIITAANATVEWLSNHSHKNPTLLTAMQGILYVPKNPRKLGQVTKNNAEGMTPIEAAQSRYNDKSTLSEDLIIEDIFVFDKIYGENFDYDDLVRKEIHRLFKAGKIPFDANCPGHQLPGNSEALHGYSRRKHVRILRKVIRQALGIEQYWDARQRISWRWGQEDEVNEVVEALVNHGLCLYAAYTGRGKTTISVGVVSKLLKKGGLVLVTTPIKDTRDGFEDKIKNWNFGGDRNRKVTFIDNYGFAKTTVKELRERADNGELIFIVLTVQDLRWQDSKEAETLRSKYQALAGNLDVWIRDEFHKEYNAELTAARLGNISAKYTLDLTATPYGLMNGYKPEQVVSRTLIWGLLNRKNTKLPQLLVDAIATPFQNINPALTSCYSEEEGFDPRKLFAMKNGNFVFQGEFIALDKMFYQSTVSKNKNQLSIVNDTDLSPISKRCGMWRCPDGTAEYPASEYLQILAKMLNTSQRNTYYVSSYYVEEQASKQNKTINDYVNDMLSRHERVVILTCGKFTTGTDIEALGHIVLMDNITSINVFEQLMGRMMRVLTGKESVKLYSLMPGQQIRIVLGRLRREAAKLMGTSETEMYDCIPFTEYDTGKPQRIEVSELLKAAQEWSLDLMSESSFRSTEFDLLTSADLGDLMLALPNPKGRGKASGKMLLNEKNNAKVKTRKGGKARAKNEAEEFTNKDRKAYLTVLQSVMREIRWVSKTQDCYDLDTILDSKILKDRFGAELIDCLKQISKRNEKFAQSQNDRLAEYKEAFAGLEPDQYHDLVFQNSKENQKALNLVYASMDTAKFVASFTEKAGKAQRIRNIRKIGIMNAQSGSIVLAVKAQYPDAKIVCLEEFTHFSHFLKDLGVGIEKLDMNSRKNYDLIVAMPPIDIRTYRKYFKYAVEHARLVACVMPYITDDRENELHRGRVRDHKISVSKSLADMYPSMANYTEVKCVVATGSVSA